MDKELIISDREFASIESGLSLISKGLDFTRQASELLEGAGAEDDPRKLDALQLSFECICAECGLDSGGSSGVVIDSNESFSSAVAKIRAFIKRMIDAIIKTVQRVGEWVVTVFTRTSMARNMMKERATATLKKLGKFGDNLDIEVKITELTKIENLLEGWKMPENLVKSFTLMAKLIDLIKPDTNLAKDYDRAVKIVVDDLKAIAAHNQEQDKKGSDDRRGYYTPEAFVKAVKIIHKDGLDAKRWMTNLVPGNDVLAASNLTGANTDYRIAGYTMGNQMVLGKYTEILGLAEPVFSGYYWGRIPKPSTMETKETKLSLKVKEARTVCTQIRAFVDAIDPVEKEYLKISKIALRPLVTAKKLADDLESVQDASHFAGLLRMFESMIRASVVFPAQLSSIGMRASFSALVVIERGLIDLEM